MPTPFEVQEHARSCSASSTDRYVGTEAPKPEEGLRDEQYWRQAIEKDYEMLGHAPLALRQDRELLSKLLAKHGLALMHCTGLRGDRSLVLTAVRQNGGAFAYAEPALRGDRGLALEAVQRSGLALQFASESLRNDKELVMQAVEHCGFALQFAPPVLREDLQVAMKAVRQNGDVLKLLSKELRANPKLVLEALKSSAPASLEVENLSDSELALALEARGSPLRHADLPLRADRHVVLEAVKQDGSALFFADEALKEDRGLVQQAVRRTGWALRLVPSKWRKDRALALEAVEKDAVALKFVAEELQQNAGFVCEAVSRNGDALRYVGSEFLWDLKVVQCAVRQNGLALRFAVPELRSDLSLVREATKSTPKAFAYACGPLKWDRPLVTEMLSLDGTLLQHLPQELRCDRDVVTAAVQQKGRAIMWASGSLKQDVTVALEAVKQDGTALQLVSEAVKSFRNVGLEAVKQTTEALQFVDKHLRSDVDFAIAITQSNPEVADAAAAELEVPTECLLSIARKAELRFEKEAMLEMIRESGWRCLRLAGSTVRQEEEVQKAAVEQSWRSVKWMLEPTLAVVLTAVGQDLAAAELLGSIEENMKAIVAMNHPEVIKYPAFAGRTPLLAALRQNGQLLQFATPELREDFKVVEAALSQSPQAIRFARGAALAKLKAQQQATAPILSSPAATQQADLLPWAAGKQALEGTKLCEDDSYLAKWRDGSVDGEWNNLEVGMNRETPQWIWSHFPCGRWW
ncbi:unnamed protein product [Durusdinium trenchii]|uniref:DUF4116 domain-containing protein n=1 Tax=Durusdinium trenchii TaxID=1381693 RepID=A0ABP0L751_9DINO